MGTLFALTFVLAGLLPMPAATAFRGRTVRGKVYDSTGATVKGAAVQLKNTSTLSIRSYLTRQDGSYRFVGLSLDHEYELRASYAGHWSSTETISRFDSNEFVEVDLKIHAPQAMEDAWTTCLAGFLHSFDFDAGLVSQQASRHNGGGSTLVLPHLCNVETNAAQYQCALRNASRIKHREVEFRSERGGREFIARR